MTISWPDLAKPHTANTFPMPATGAERNARSGAVWRFARRRPGWVAQFEFRSARERAGALDALLLKGDGQIGTVWVPVWFDRHPRSGPFSASDVTNAAPEPWDDGALWDDGAGWVESLLAALGVALTQAIPAGQGWCEFKNLAPGRTILKEGDRVGFGRNWAAVLTADLVGDAGGYGIATFKPRAPYDIPSWAQINLRTPTVRMFATGDDQLSRPVTAPQRSSHSLSFAEDPLTAFEN
mgnify:CR=1 FL=1